MTKARQLANFTFDNPVYAGTLTGSGNFGVGTTSPVASIQTGDGTQTIREVRTSTLGGVSQGGFVRGYRAGNPSYYVGDSAPITGLADGGLTVYSYGTNPLDFYTDGTKRVTIGASGNIGLGVTPSAWAANRKVFELPSGSYLWGRTDLNQTILGNNNYFDGSFKYKATAAASMMELSNGGHYWYIAPSGTAGNPISFTQAMTLGTNGILDVPFGFRSAGSGTAIGVFGSGAFTAGAVGIGTTDNTPLVFGTNSTERARIDSSGNLIVGSVGGGQHTLSKDNPNNYGAAVYNTAATNPYGFFIGLSNTNGGGASFLDCVDSGAIRLRILGSGNVVNINNSYGAMSDLKLKENITDVTPKLDKLLQVRIVNYTLKTDPNQAKLMGVVAQEIEQIFPSMVEETPDLDEDRNDLGTTTKSVKYSVFVPMLIKAMQEQQAQIRVLQQEVQALKGAN
jgi:hypothetical protein